MSITTDTARLPLLLTMLRLPTVAKLWPGIGETADTEGWPAARTLATLLEYEVAERANRAPLAILPRHAFHLARLSCPLLSGPSTVLVWTMKEKQT
jgi:hypothetical protein